MRRILDIVTRVVYVLSGAFYFLLGVVVLLLGTGLLPIWVHDRVFEMGQNNPFAMHLIQETGTLWVLVGLLLFWFAWHYGQSFKFHWLFTFYLLLDAFVHWFSAYGRFENEPRALINAIPFFLFLGLGVLRWHFRRSAAVLHTDKPRRWHKPPATIGGSDLSTAHR